MFKSPLYYSLLHDNVETTKEILKLGFKLPAKYSDLRLQSNAWGPQNYIINLEPLYEYIPLDFIDSVFIECALHSEESIDRLFKYLSNYTVYEVGYQYSMIVLEGLLLNRHADYLCSKLKGLIKVSFSIRSSVHNHSYLIEKGALKSSPEDVFDYHIDYVEDDRSYNFELIGDWVFSPVEKYAQYLGDADITWYGGLEIPFFNVVDDDRIALCGDIGFKCSDSLESHTIHKYNRIQRIYEENNMLFYNLMKMYIPVKVNGDHRIILTIQIFNTLEYVDHIMDVYNMLIESTYFDIYEIHTKHKLNVECNIVRITNNFATTFLGNIYLYDYDSHEFFKDYIINISKKYADTLAISYIIIDSSNIDDIIKSIG